jgi:hypothetical protein
MRLLAWLSGLLLVLSCSVNPVQNPDGSETGAGGTSGGGGQAGATSGGGGHGGAIAGDGGGAGDRQSGGAGGGQAGAGGGLTGAGGGAAGAAGGSAGHAGGGQGGHPADGGETCAELETDYDTALSTARQCTPGSPNQCQHLVDRSLSCPGCQEYVNDVTQLDILEAEWNDQDCGAMLYLCPQIDCVNPGTGTCMGGGGPAQCQNGAPVPLN